MGNMAELKLRQLYRGFILTDFDGNDIGCKDSEHAVDEIRRLLMVVKTDDGQIIEDLCIQKRKPNNIELHRNIFERAKEQIDVVGKYNGAQIARDLHVNNSTVHSHLRKMSIELDELIKKWQEERDKKMLNVETRTTEEGDKFGDKLGDKLGETKSENGG